MSPTGCGGRGGAPPPVLPIRVYDGPERLSDPDRIDQYVGVLQTRETFIAGTTGAGLARVEAESLPFFPEGVSAGALGPSFRAMELDWSLALTEEEIVLREGPAAIVEIAEITTVVGEDGTVRTRSAYSVRNRSLQFLMVELPEGAELWGVTLEGKPVAVGTSAGGEAGSPGAIRIPVERVGSASMDLDVAVQYGERPLGLPALRGRAALLAPRLPETRVPKSLLEQLQKITKEKSETDNKSVRDEAEREIQRLEQALGDNLAELMERNRSPEVVLFDIGLHGIDGFEVARRLREGESQRNLFLVALTGYGQEEDRRRSREAGFDRHLVKPVHPEVLRELIQNLEVRA